MLARSILVALAWTFANFASAQTPPAPADAAIQKSLNAEADRLCLKFLDNARSLEEWQHKRPRL